MNEKKLKNQLDDFFTSLCRNYCIDRCLNREDDFEFYIIENLHRMLYPQAYSEEE